MHGLLLLFLQIAVILIAARVVGGVFRRLGQPQVVGEMIAGILLGPSLLGALAPKLEVALFPPASLGAIHALSQVGLLLFMFLIGLELDPKLLRGRGHAAVITSHASIIAPFLLGACLALHLFPRYSDEGVAFTPFALFIGAAMSVTAFPVLARILTERNLLGTKMGAVTIACAAVDDVTAWCILAGVVALARSAGGGSALLVTFAGSAIYVVAMLKLVRPALGRLEAYYHNRGRMTQDVVAGVVLLLLASAWTTEWLGIHALFGAFLMGAIMPKEPGFVHDLAKRFEDVTVVLFLPLFFAYTGLRTTIGLLDEPSLWIDCALVTLVAVAGKLGGSAVAARLTGLSWREAGALGTLMNTRGLMELVILTIGFDLGIISPVVFVMMVVMALVTTMMTTPLLEWIYPLEMIRRETIATDEHAREEGILIPVALPSSGPELLAAARELAPASGGARIYALHLVRPDDRALLDVAVDARPSEHAALKPLLDFAKSRDAVVRPLTFVSRSFGEDVADVARAKAASLILMGWHKPVVSSSILGGSVYEIMQRSGADVVVYVGRRSPPWTRVLVPFARGPHDRRALELAARIAANGAAEVVVLHVVPPRRGDDVRAGASEILESMGPERVSLKVVPSEDPMATLLDEARANYDLIVVGATEAWGLEPRLFNARHEKLADATNASLMIVRRSLSAEETARAAAATVPEAATT